MLEKKKKKNLMDRSELSNLKLIIFIKWPDDSYRQPNYPYHISVIPLNNLSDKTARDINPTLGILD